jgi:hypothetical protein
MAHDIIRMKTILGQRAANDIRGLQMPKEDLVDLIEIAVAELSFVTGIDIRDMAGKMLQAALGEPQVVKVAGSENPYRGRYATPPLVRSRK